MYCGNVTRVLIYSQRNCILQKRSKHFIENGTIQTKCQNRILVFCSLFLRNMTPAVKLNGLSKGLKSIGAQYPALRILKHELLKIPSFLKKHSVHIVRTCTQQCECVVAHRIRRGQQIFSLYTRLWDERALKELVGRMRQQLARRGKLMLWGSVGVVANNGDKITEEEMRSYINDFDFINSLRDTTMTCTDCHQRQIVDVEVPNILYCTCPGNEPATPKLPVMCVLTAEEWIPFIQRQDLTVWRKEEKDGLYAYKVFGKYDDVSAADFLKVQVDIQYRREWDPMAVRLEVIESDPANFSETIYWEMEWPRMFSNRDYVFNRRYLVDHKQKVIVLVNKCTTHPAYPPSKNLHRVTDYYSYMVIKPIKEFTDPGIEFSLTYFDNPGITLPTALSSWAAKSALPEFLSKIRAAALQMAKQRMQNKDDQSVSVMPIFGVVKEKILEPSRDLIGEEEVVIEEEEVAGEEETVPDDLHEPDDGFSSPPGERSGPKIPSGTEPETSYSGRPYRKPSPHVPTGPVPPDGKSGSQVPGGSEPSTTSSSPYPPHHTYPGRRSADGVETSGEDRSPEKGSGDHPSHSGGDSGVHSDPTEHSRDECSNAEASKSKEDQPKGSIYFTSFPYQDPPDVSYLQFHTANQFT